MDAKALAKSKRAHTQHHSKKSHHLTQKPKTSSNSSENPRDSKKQLGKQVGEKSHEYRRASALPSNWDRYDEEFDSYSEDPSGDGVRSQPSDVVVPKSKGGDYCHLIAEAQADSESKLNLNMESFSSLDDILYDEFSRLVGSMLSARGEGILSWVEDDNFVVEDGTASSHEAAFLSLNLNALAEQLEKVDLHERLFIEADLLPPELCADRSKASSDQTSQENEAATTSEGHTVQDFTEKLKIAEKRIEPTSLVPPRDILDSSSSELESDMTVKVKDDSISNQLGKTLNPEFDLNPVATSKKKFSTFEASAAAAELDMLLDSIGEAKADKPSGSITRNAFGHNQKDESKRTPPQHSATKTGMSGPAAPTANFDDVLDDLLEQTSNMMKPQSKSLSHENQTSTSSSSRSVGKSKMLDDFDSWLDTI